MVVVCNIPNTDDPVTQVVPCISVVNSLEKESLSNCEVILDMSKVTGTGWIGLISFILLMIGIFQPVLTSILN